MEVLGPVVLAMFTKQFLSLYAGVTPVKLSFSQGRSGCVLQYQPYLANALPSASLHNDYPAIPFPETSAENKRCFQKYLER